MKPSGRLIVDADGKAVPVRFDETGKSPNDSAHGYDQAQAAGRRFKARQKLTAAQKALLLTLPQKDQDALLDRAPDERAKYFADMAAAADAAKAKAVQQKPAGDKGDGK